MSGRVDDLVNELRHVHRNGLWTSQKPRKGREHPVCARAADEIERLRARVADLQATVNEWAGV